MLNTTFMIFLILAWNLFGTTRRRSRSSGFKGLDTVITIAAVGALGFGAYFVLRSGKGVEEGLDSFGDALKSFTDAGNSTGDWIGDRSYDIQRALGIGSGGSEETSIIGGLKRSVKGDVEAKKKRYASTWGPFADAVDSTGHFLGGLGCGVIRKC